MNCYATLQKHTYIVVTLHSIVSLFAITNAMLYAIRKFIQTYCY